MQLFNTLDRQDSFLVANLVSSLLYTPLFFTILHYIAVACLLPPTLQRGGYVDTSTDKGMDPATKVNQTHVFDQFDVCILTKKNREMY